MLALFHVAALQLQKSPGQAQYLMCFNFYIYSVPLQLQPLQKTVDRLRVFAESVCKSDKFDVWFSRHVIRV